MSMVMYFSLIGKDKQLIYEDRKPDKRKNHIKDIRELDLSNKGLRAVNHYLTFYNARDGVTRIIGNVKTSCGHDMHKLYNLANCWLLTGGKPIIGI